MKTKFFFASLAVTVATLLFSPLPACSAFNEEDTGIAIKLAVSAEDDTPQHALSPDSPFHVVAFAREKACKPFYSLFESDAYVGRDGNIIWMGIYRYWPGEFTKFIAYWPADANVEIDDRGNIISSDCILIAETEPYYHYSENPVLIFHSN